MAGQVISSFCVLSFMFQKSGLAEFDRFQYGVGDAAACAAGDGEEGDVEESAFVGAEDEGGYRVGEEAADEGGADEFTEDGHPEFSCMAVKVAREEGPRHGAGEGKEASCAGYIPYEGSGEGSRDAVPCAGEDGEKNIYHVLDREGAGHAEGEGKNGREENGHRRHEGGEDHFPKGDTMGRICHRNLLERMGVSIFSEKFYYSIAQISCGEKKEWRKQGRNGGNGLY